MTEITSIAGMPAALDSTLISQAPLDGAGLDALSTLRANSARFEGGMGAVAWAVLEMFRRGGMESGAMRFLQDQMDTYFARPSSEDCNDILRVVRERLESDWLEREESM